MLTTNIFFFHEYAREHHGGHGEKGQELRMAPPSYAVAIVMLLMIAMPCVPHWSQREYATRHKRLRKRAASYCRSHCEAVADRSNLLAQNRKTSSAKS